MATMASASVAKARSHMGRGKKTTAAGKATKIKFVIDCQKPVDDNILEAKGLVSGPGQCYIFHFLGSPPWPCRLFPRVPLRRLPHTCL